MKITITKIENLLKLTTSLKSGMFESNPVISIGKIDSSDPGLYLFHRNSEHWISLSIDNIIEKSDIPNDFTCATFAYDAFISKLRSFNKADKVTISIKDNKKLELISDGYHLYVDLSKEEVSDYLKVSFDTCDTTKTHVEMSIKDLLIGFSNCKPSISNDSVKFYLQGVLFEVLNDNTVNLVATCGHILSKIKLPQSRTKVMHRDDQKENDVCRVTIPDGAVKSMIGIIQTNIEQKDLKCEIKFNDDISYWSFPDGTTAYHKNIQNGEYPDYTRALGGELSDKEMSFNVDTKDFITVIERIDKASSVGDPSHNKIGYKKEFGDTLKIGYNRTEDHKMIDAVLSNAFKEHSHDILLGVNSRILNPTIKAILANKACYYNTMKVRLDTFDSRGGQNNLDIVGKITITFVGNEDDKIFDDHEITLMGARTDHI